MSLHGVTYRAAPVDVPIASRPSLFLVVDTEEEFNWDAPFSRDATTVSAIGDVHRLQRVVRPYGVAPTYVVDYPIAVSPLAADTFKPLVAEDACTIGAHLHPWVNPPFVETVSRANSYGCNLDPALERRKIWVLKEAILEGLGVEARVYKAGRYGFGPSTAWTLEALGFDVDMSVNPHMDFSGDGGPSFAALDARPFRFGVDRTLLSIPCSTGFVGLARSAGRTLHAMAASALGVRAHVPGILARLGVVNKVMLSPEGYTLQEMCDLAACLHAEGVRTFSLTLHSPSLAPGHTSYARTREDVDRLLGTIDGFLNFFFTKLGGQAETPLAFHRKVCAGSSTGDKSLGVGGLMSASHA